MYRAEQDEVLVINGVWRQLALVHLISIVATEESIYTYKL